MISETTIQAVKSAMNVVDIVSEFVKLKKQGTNQLGLCPFHNEKSPSFTVSPSKGIYKCFGCGKSGDGISFLIEHEKKTYAEAISFLAGKYGIEVEELKTKDFVKPIARLEKLSKKILDWFENERKISNNTLLRLKVTEAKEFMPQIKQEATCMCFNYYRNDELVNIKFRGPKKSFKLAKDAELIFFNIDAIKDEDTCIIVEGEIDALTLHECGIYNVVSVPNGASKGARLEYLDNCFEYFVRKTKIILAVDNDEPGKLLREELARRLGTEKCYQVSYPEDCKDANDVLVKHGRDAVNELIDTAFEWPVIGVVPMEIMFPDVLDFYENGYPKGLQANIPGFDELINFYPGQLTTITGIPGSGKSEFADLIMTSLSKYHNIVWGVCSFENPPKFHVTKLAEKLVNKAFDHRKDPMNRMNKAQFDYAIATIDKYFRFINLSLIDVTMDGLIEKAKELVERYGITGLLFDPWNCIEAKYSDGESETKYVLNCLNKLLNFLDKYEVHGLLVAHPTKLNKDKSSGKYEIPTMYSISGSAHFFNRTHNGISIYRDFQTNVVDVYVQKIKWSWLGKLGKATFNYNTLTREYINPDVPSGFRKIDTGDLFVPQ